MSGKAEDHLAHFSHPKHRESAGPPGDFDRLSALQFQLLAALGLRDFHFVLDIGCGPLTAGRLLIPYLLPHRYFAVEPNQRLLEEGVRLELGHDQLALKKPVFLTCSDFCFSRFGIQFDYMMAHSVFTHAAAPQIAKCLQEAFTCLRKNGVLAASWRLGSKDYPDLEWSGGPSVEYRESTMREIAAAAGLNCQVIDWPHPAGETWALFYERGVDPWPEPLDVRPPLTRLTQLLLQDGTQPGFIENIVDTGASLLISGWAIQPETGRRATHVLFADNDELILAAARVEISRPDVAAVHGPESLCSGFRARIGGLTASHIRNIRCFSFTQGETKAFAFPASPPPGERSGSFGM